MTLKRERDAARPGVVIITGPPPNAPSLRDSWMAGWISAASALGETLPARNPQPTEGDDFETHEAHANYADQDVLWQQGRDGTADQGYLARAACLPTAEQIQVDCDAGAMCIRIAGERTVRLQGSRPTNAFFDLWRRHRELLKSVGIYLTKTAGQWTVYVGEPARPRGDTE